MIHAREDYNRIQDPEHKIKEDEPVILFRAQDKYFNDVLSFYLQLIAQDEQVQNEMIQSITNHLVLSTLWRSKNKDKIKTPDIPLLIDQTENTSDSQPLILDIP